RPLPRLSAAPSESLPKQRARNRAPFGDAPWQERSSDNTGLELAEEPVLSEPVSGPPSLPGSLVRFQTRPLGACSFRPITRQIPKQFIASTADEGGRGPPDRGAQSKRRDVRPAPGSDRPVQGTGPGGGVSSKTGEQPLGRIHRAKAAPSPPGKPQRATVLLAMQRAFYRP